jgi:hypothetical protein
MSFMFNTQIEEVSQIQRGLGDAMAEMLTERGWAVGLDEVKRAIDVLFDDPWDKTPIFMPPEVQQLLKEKIHKRTGQSHQEQRAERDEAIDPARVATRPSDATETRTGGDERK